VTSHRSTDACRRPRLRELAALILAVGLTVLSVASIADAGALPILAGPWGRDQQGYGHARPGTVNNGGDPTGIVQHIHWSSWGGARAVGTGVAEYVGPRQSVAEGTQETARIVAFQLGQCHGHRAYDAIEWYFPQHGDHFNSHQYINDCTGKYYPLVPGE
jgi:hypothetical protein